MRTTRFVVLGASIVASRLVVQMARALQAGIARTELQRHDLGIAGREVVQTIVELGPGVTSSRHRHPGERIVYVFEGAPLEYQIEGKPSVTLKPGEVLFIPAGIVHAAKNVGSRTGAELAIYIVQKGGTAHQRSQRSHAEVIRPSFAIASRWRSTGPSIRRVVIPCLRRSGT